MKKIMFFSLAFSVCFYFLSFAAGQNESSIENSVVKIFTVSNEPDFMQPWQMMGQKS